MKGLIVDVRSNPGGLVTSVVDILDQILPELDKACKNNRKKK